MFKKLIVAYVGTSVVFGAGTSLLMRAAAREDRKKYSLKDAASAFTVGAACWPQIFVMPAIEMAQEAITELRK